MVPKINRWGYKIYLEKTGDSFTFVLMTNEERIANGKWISVGDHIQMLAEKVSIWDEHVDTLVKIATDKKCLHPDIATDGGGDYCKQCSFRWDR